MSWQILLVVMGAEFAALFVVAFVVGIGLRVLRDIFRRPQHASAGSDN